MSTLKFNFLLIFFPNEKFVFNFFSRCIQLYFYDLLNVNSFEQKKNLECCYIITFQCYSLKKTIQICSLHILK